MSSAWSKVFFCLRSYPLRTETWALHAVVLLTSLIGCLPVLDKRLLVAVCSLSWSLKLSVLVVQSLSPFVKMFTNFAVSDFAECLDEFGVWSEVVAVTFPRWSKVFDRSIEDRGELRAKSSLEMKWRYSDLLKVEWTFVPSNQTYRKINETAKEPSIMPLR